MTTLQTQNGLTGLRVFPRFPNCNKEHPAFVEFPGVLSVSGDEKFVDVGIEAVAERVRHYMEQSLMGMTSFYLKAFAEEFFTDHATHNGSVILRVPFNYGGLTYPVSFEYRKQDGKVTEYFTMARTVPNLTVDIKSSYNLLPPWDMVADFLIKQCEYFTEKNGSLPLPYIVRDIIKAHRDSFDSHNIDVVLSVGPHIVTIKEVN